MSPPFAEVPPTHFEPETPTDVIELGLLLPHHRFLELIELAERRRATVAQLLRSLIDQALASAN
ncbi:MAG: hypothetical protein SFX72_18610 [Isosphaeraceae bacterium]|nr:hypothetical protein [Isosphaeraceae bacterium]